MSVRRALLCGAHVFCFVPFISCDIIYTYIYICVYIISHDMKGLRRAAKLRIELPKSLLCALGHGIRFRIEFLFLLICLNLFRTVFRRRPRAQKAARLHACNLVSLLA